MYQDVVLRVRVLTPRSPTSAPDCEGCGVPLELHQPVASRPGQILGTCPACGEWHFLGLDDDGLTRRVARLPVAELESPPPDLQAD